MPLLFCLLVVSVGAEQFLYCVPQSTGLLDAEKADCLSLSVKCFCPETSNLIPLNPRPFKWPLFNI